MAKIDGYDEIFSSDKFRSSNEGVELSPDICSYAGFGVPVFMSHRLYNAHLPDMPTQKAMIASKDSNILNTLVTLRYVSPGWNDTVGHLETQVPAAEGTKELSMIAFLVLSSMPFIVLSEAAEVDEIRKEEGWPDFP